MGVASIPRGEKVALLLSSLEILRRSCSIKRFFGVPCSPSASYPLPSLPVNYGGPRTQTGLVHPPPPPSSLLVYILIASVHRGSETRVSDPVSITHWTFKDPVGQHGTKLFIHKLDADSDERSADTDDESTCPSPYLHPPIPPVTPDTLVTCSLACWALQCLIHYYLLIYFFFSLYN